MMEEDAKRIDEVTECPYVVGNKITLQLEGRPVQATIVKTFEPWTQSCAMVLSFDSDLSAIGIEGNVVLKIYDRRFSTELRSLWKRAGPWTPEIERDLYKLLCSDEGMEFAIEYERSCIKEREEEHGFIPTIIEEDTSEEQDQQNTHEQEGTNKSDSTNGNGNAKSKGTLSIFSMLSIKLFSPLFHGCKIVFRGLSCAIRFFASGNNPINKYHRTTGEQQTNNLEAVVEDPEESENEEEEWDRTCEEVDTYVAKQILYEAEIRAYETMKDLQGIYVPRIFAHTKMLGPKYTQDQPFSRYFEHPGILMEYIEGFPLHELPENAPRKAWHPIVDKAIEIVNNIMRHGVLNDDTNV
ncbi:hypothetical protein PENVUL_c003G08151 [Penicillium vulpinum]|uniref:Protein kinase domain-containing protein n=1 Tax=Penicillium vulpinum TaxID=29845 RepID=A0A1V6SAD0_9EURO|nr:hypothetical protein PENVUL_c003G08151 [Penicillium vulpinum]